ncbi:MAG: DHH family phosphoesterase [Nitrososphaerota archaeon]|jgi:RecJ-like exonuclease|nr:DHH family phosphoesterase [Nitrososphaerota archaeon]
MADIEGLRKAASAIARNLRKNAVEKSNVFLAGPPDCDGIASIAILCKSIFANGGLFNARFYNFLSTQEIENIADDAYDSYVFVDLAEAREKEIYEALKEKAIFIGHHDIQGEDGEYTSLNASKFGFDGSKEISGSGLAYLVSKELLPNPNSAAWLAVVGALGDRQDIGPKRSLVGLNELFVQDAIDTAQVEVREDLMLFGREVKPIHEAISYTYDPFIQGLTGNKDVCMSALASSKIELKNASKWRVSSDLSKEERDKLLLTLTSYLEVSGDNISSLLGNTYLLRREDEHSYLKDCRDFASLLDACGRLGEPGVGLSVCLGDRGRALSESERLLIEYRKSILRSVNLLLSNEDRVLFNDSLVTVTADGIISESMAGALASSLAAIPKIRERVLMLRVPVEDSLIQFSVRKGNWCSAEVDVGQSVRKIAQSMECHGGGHRVMATARVSALKASEFAERLRKELKS